MVVFMFLEVVDERFLLHFGLFLIILKLFFKDLQLLLTVKQLNLHLLQLSVRRFLLLLIIRGQVRIWSCGHFFLLDLLSSSLVLFRQLFLDNVLLDVHFLLYYGLSHERDPTLSFLIGRIQHQRHIPKRVHAKQRCKPIKAQSSNLFKLIRFSEQLYWRCKVSQVSEKGSRPELGIIVVDDPVQAYFFTKIHSFNSLSHLLNQWNFRVVKFQVVTGDKGSASQSKGKVSSLLGFSKGNSLLVGILKIRRSIAHQRPKIPNRFRFPNLKAFGQLLASHIDVIVNRKKDFGFTLWCKTISLIHGIVFCVVEVYRSFPIFFF